MMTLTITMNTTTSMVLEGGVTVATEMVVTDTVPSHPCDMMTLTSTVTSMTQEHAPVVGDETQHPVDLTTGTISMHRAECIVTTEMAR